MPKGPKGQKRPADVISNAVHAMKIATGEIVETLTLGPDTGLRLTKMDRAASRAIIQSR
jgi:hypothetical protein